MNRKVLSTCLTFTWLISLFMTTISPALAQDWQDLSSDIDGDGLLNETEIAGWYNAAGGPFYTDPQDADSDDDGLTDGEEKLFDTTPVNGSGNLDGAKSPGLYVRYKDDYKTKEYFRTADPAYLSMKQAGGRYLLTEAMVARRGDILQIGGPVAGSLSVTGTGLGSLPVQSDLYGGGWNVTLPSTSGGRTGTYTATLTLPGEDPLTMPIYVIFEMPSTATGSDWVDNLSAGDISAFLYNGDPNDRRDETAVIWRTRGGSYVEDSFTYRHAQGWAESFWTDQYKKYVFVDHVMPRIHGQTNQNDATEALSEGADYEIRVDYDNYYDTEMYTTLFKKRYNGSWWEYCTKCTPDDDWWQDGTPCHSQAGVFTAFLRSAGIPARPFIADWSSSSYDTAVLIWFDNEWRAGRSYRAGESGNLTYEYYPHDRGITNDSVLSYWDWRGSYRESNSEILVVADENWDYEQWRDKQPGETCTIAESGGYGSTPPGEECFLGGMVDTKFPPYTHQVWAAREFLWYSKQPLQLWDKHPYMDTMNTIVWHGESWLPSGWPDAFDLPDPYPGGNINENWPIEPVPQRCTAGYLGDCPYPPVGGTSVETSGVSIGALDASSQGILLPLIQTEGIQLGPVVNDSARDIDNNGRFDELVFDVEVTVDQPGRYLLGGIINLPDDVTPYGSLFSENQTFDLIAGTQTIQLTFDGSLIGQYRVDGPYQLTGLWITDSERFDVRLDPWDMVLATSQLQHATRFYTFDQFEGVAPALLADEFSHYGLDNNNDGFNETLNIDVVLDISEPGVYIVEGDLYDEQNNLVGHANWTGSGSIATLAFDEIVGTIPPYRLENLRLFAEDYALLDSRAKVIYKITDLGPVAQAGVTMNVYLPASGDGTIGTMDITSTMVFSDRVVELDTPANGYDQLIVDVQVNVTPPDENAEYRVEGWLEAPDGTLVAYGISDPTYLTTGLQMLSLPFDGRMINGQGIDGPYRVIALRILRGSTYDVLDEVAVTPLQLNYDAAEFEPDTEVASIFSDDIESGSGNWSSQSPWNRVEKTWAGLSSYLWEAASTAQDGSLSITLDLSGYVNPLLRFQNTYKMASASDIGYVEASTNGVDWTQVATYTNTTDRWETPVLDLSPLEKNQNVQLQFNANASSYLLWDVDNVDINGWPAVTDVTFDYSKPVIAGENIDFEADYASIDMTLPVTYTWDFGDGSTASGATATHQFAEGDYLVQLTVENPYDSETVSHLVGSGEPVTGATFTYEPLVPESTKVISFTASYAPLTATNNITHPVIFEWDFGDSTTITTTNHIITHTYGVGGEYLVQLTASNGFGTGMDNQLIEVKEGVASVDFIPSGTLIEDDTVTFSTQILPPTASQPVTYTWVFDDGTEVITTTESVEHVFDTPASYQVMVTADNSYGTPAVYSDTVVIDGRPVSTAEFTYDQTQANTSETEVTFNATYGPVNATQPITYTWDFGDGNPAQLTTTPTITYEFPTTDTYTVELSVSNGYGSPILYSHVITVPVDSDGDGLINWYELNTSNTDPNDPDSDNDGRTDGEEVNGYVYTGYAAHADYGAKIYTNPLDADSDDDGMLDGDEFATGAHPGDTDTDDDGLMDGEEPGTHGSTSPVDADSDDDGLEDGAEVNIHNTDPLNPDTDGDGLTDGDEVNTHHTDPLNPDSDSDGLTDGEEINYTTNPLNPDSDNDGIDDSIEVLGTPYQACSSIPCNTHSGTSIDALNTDSDNDGIPDADEWDEDQNSSSYDDLCSNYGLDTDGDGIPNCQDNDADGDDIPNYRDSDSDSEGDNDEVEGVGDDDGDEIPNFLDSDIFFNAPSRSIYLPLIIRNN